MCSGEEWKLIAIIFVKYNFVLLKGALIMFITDKYEIIIDAKLICLPVFFFFLNG